MCAAHKTRIAELGQNNKGFPVVFRGKTRKITAASSKRESLLTAVMSCWLLALFAALVVSGVRQRLLAAAAARDGDGVVVVAIGLVRPKFLTAVRAYSLDVSRERSIRRSFVG